MELKLDISDVKPEHLTSIGNDLSSFGRRSSRQTFLKHNANDLRYSHFNENVQTMIRNAGSAIFYTCDDRVQVIIRPPDKE